MMTQKTGALIFDETADRYDIRFDVNDYIDDAGWFMNAAQSLATFFVLPAVIALLGSYMICREEQEDTIKSVSYTHLDVYKRQDQVILQVM